MSSGPDDEQPLRKQEDPTLPPGATAGREDVTLPPQRSDEDTAIPDPRSPDEPTIPPTLPSADNNVSVGDQIRYFGDYELLEEIARGGMGVVYKARQTNLNRTVALKMILAGQFAGDEDVQRFYTEAEAAARLDHPGIVPIFEIGEYSGQHYFSMAFVEGESLALAVADGPLPARESAHLVQQICSAIAYAHDKGVIHRDLKPANILVDPGGQPKVTDFGLAKQAESDSQLTGTGQILGTPAYMPPEQASGNTAEVGPLSDVYSIGAILYCLLTGRPPFQAASPMDTLLQVLEQQPVAPRTLNPQVPEDLNTICMKCLEKDPEQRYSSAAEVGEDLSRYLNHEPIVAKPPSMVRLIRFWISQNVGAIGWAAIVGIALGLFVAIHTMQRDIGLYLNVIGDNLASLRFPSELHPWFTHVPQFPLWLQGVLQMLLIVSLVISGLLVAALVRPKNRPADVIAGGLAGFFGASTVFLLCFSWTGASGKINVTTEDLIELSKTEPGQAVSNRLLVRYPSLRNADRETQRDIAWNLARYRHMTGAAIGVFNGFLLSTLLFIPACVCETMLAGSLIRRYQNARSAMLPYLEIGIPCGVIVLNLIVHHLLVWMGFVRTGVPLWASMLLYIPLIAATIAAFRRFRWPWRILLHAAWIGPLIAIMMGQVPGSKSIIDKRPVLGVAATDDPDRCEIRFVVPNSPASRAGLGQGDVITHFDGAKVDSFPQLQELIRTKEVDDEVTVTVLRNGTETDYTVKLGRRNQ